MSAVLLESRPYRPFKSQDEYLVAMREDLAEWLQEMYPILNITAETFMDKLETGVALCEHANACRALAFEYVQKKQAKQIMMKSITGSVATAQSLIRIADVNYIAVAKSGTFFARDNLSNFIHWCRHSLKIIECLLFESDDLILRKNEKHVILCLLEVARKGAKFGVPAPMLVQMERQIDREIAADQRKLVGQNASCQTTTSTSTNGDDDEDSETEGETQPPMIYGPLPQIVTNDLKSLDEMVRDLVEICTCPTQFKMIRLSEGKYRIGDTNTLIFVRILRNHVMVRVGGGWDTLSHYLEKHDPCRCRSQHKATLGARLVSKPGAHDLAGAHVYYDRSTVSPYSSSSSNNVTTDSSRGGSHLGPPMNSLNRSRSRSPTAALNARRSVSPNLPRRNHQQQQGMLGLGTSSLGVGSRTRSRSPTPYYTSTHTTKLSSPNSNSTNTSPRKSVHNVNSGPASLPIVQSSYINNGGVARKKNTTNLTNATNANNGTTHVSTLHITPEQKQKQAATATTTEVTATNGDTTTDQQSDNGSEVSDEGYRSLGILDKSNGQRCNPSSQSVNSPNSSDDAEYNEQHDSIIDIPTDDDTNDFGLRRTNYSIQMYDDFSSPSIKPTISTTSRQNSLESTNSNTSQQQHQPQSLPYIKPTTNRVSIGATSNNNNNISSVSNGISPGSRGNSPKKSLGTGAGIKLQHGTWNGRGIGGVGEGGGNTVKSRGALSVDTFTPQGPQSLTTDFTPTSTHQQFKRNSTTRMTTGATNRSRRGSQSAHTSPNKSNNLKHDLLKTLNQCGDGDEQQLMERVHKLLKQHSSANLYSVLNSTAQDAGEGLMGVKSRRDSRADVQGTSRIPAPALTKKVS